MEILNSTLSDIPKIYNLYGQATVLMKSKKQVFWPAFSMDLITKEINENRQWKLIIDGQVACIWATTFNDPLIWGGANATPSVYIHRIAVDQNFRGRQLVSKVVYWADTYGRERDLKYIRLDTVGNNQGLIKHYQKMGFEFLGTKKLPDTDGLPAHYKEGEVCYFQKAISSE